MNRKQWINGLVICCQLKSFECCLCCCPYSRCVCRSYVSYQHFFERPIRCISGFVYKSLQVLRSRIRWSEPWKWITVLVPKRSLRSLSPLIRRKRRKVCAHFHQKVAYSQVSPFASLNKFLLRDLERTLGRSEKLEEFIYLFV